MASLGNPKTLFPDVKNKDCSQGFCRLYCPQWCYIISPPPPPFEFPDDNSSGPKISPLVIAIIGILASAFLLVSYYTLISKYCGNNDPARRRDQSQGQNEEIEGDHHPSLHEPWHVATTGLDEVIIRSITVCRYKKGDGLIDGTDCSVCLSEFEEDESIRLLPKCSHAFHVPCIDTWLRSHSNCPLCRSNIVFFSASLPQLPPPLTETPRGNESLQDIQRANDNEAVTQDAERVASDERAIQNLAGAPKTPSRVSGDLGNLEERDIVIEMRDIDRYRRFRRSFSMDRPCQSHTPIAEIIRMNQDEFVPVEDCSGDVGSSGHSAEIRKCMSSSRRVLHCVLNPVAMKRSFSSGRLFLTGHGRVRDTISLV